MLFHNYTICTNIKNKFLQNFVKYLDKYSKKVLQINYKTVTIQNVANKLHKIHKEIKVWDVMKLIQKIQR